MSTRRSKVHFDDFIDILKKPIIKLNKEIEKYEINKILPAEINIKELVYEHYLQIEDPIIVKPLSAVIDVYTLLRIFKNFENTTLHEQNRGPSLCRKIETQNKIVDVIIILTSIFDKPIYSTFG